MNKKKLYWTFQLGGWTIYGLIQVIGANIVAGQRELQWIDYAPLIIEALFFLLATHLLRKVIIERRWLSMKMTSIIPRVLVLAIVIAFLAYTVRISATYIFGLFQLSLLNIGNLIGNISANTLVIFLWMVFYFIYHYFESYNKSLKYEAAIHEIELNNLKSQLNPHFMFNALNSIRALVDDEPDKSKKAITQLSNILRNSLATDKSRLTSFEQEMTTVKDYLDLETIRYEERLNVDYEVNPSSFNFLVPPLMIQTLVENGIKHGIAKLKEGGEIKIKSTVKDENLLIKIINSGQIKIKNGTPLRSKGLGIKNTIKRLDLIYGEKATFKIYNSKNNTVITELVIPKKPEF
ncbi:MAG: sensor histidine kinase [Candidatus Cyclobacteriaceae bacterium M2_1C_046]